MRTKVNAVMALIREYQPENISNSILRLFLTFSSISFFLIVFLVQKEINLFNLFEIQLDNYVWVVALYLTAPFIFTGISLIICKHLSKSTINKVISLETSNNDFLINYLAFFFVALSIEEMTTFWVVFGMALLFTFVSEVSYFNPIFLVFGYNFYYVHTGENVKIMLISRKKLRSPQTFEFMSVRRINDYTFIEI